MPDSQHWPREARRPRRGGPGGNPQAQSVWPTKEAGPLGQRTDRLRSRGARRSPLGQRANVRCPTCTAQRALPNVRCPTCASYHLYRFPRRGLQTKGRRCNSKAPSWKAQGESFLALRERSPAGIQTAPTVKDQSVFIQTRTSAFERQLKNKDKLQ